MEETSTSTLDIVFKLLFQNHVAKSAMLPRASHTLCSLMGGFLEGPGGTRTALRCVTQCNPKRRNKEKQMGIRRNQFPYSRKSMVKEQQRWHLKTNRLLITHGHPRVQCSVSSHSVKDLNQKMRITKHRLVISQKQEMNQ